MAHQYLLKHLPRDEPDRHEDKVRKMLEPVRKLFWFTLIRKPTIADRNGMHDTESDEGLYLCTNQPLNPGALSVIRNEAVHHRFRDIRSVQEKLRCYLLGGDENRLRRQHREQSKHSSKRHR